MKNKMIFTLLLAALSLHNLSAQYNWMTANSDKKTIFVSGSAEMDLIPDEIKLEVTLKEYAWDTYVYGPGEVDIKKIEKKFFDVLEEHNIDKDKTLFGSANAQRYSWYYHWHYRRQDHKQKVYTIILDADADFLSLVNSLDFEGVAALKIVGTENKDLQKHRKEVKIMAVKAAKEKAEYLLESVGAKLGAIISISEVPDQNNRYRNYDLQSNYRSNVSNDRGSFGDAGIAQVETIKLRYVVNAYFEIIE